MAGEASSREHVESRMSICALTFCQSGLRKRGLANGVSLPVFSSENKWRNGRKRKGTERKGKKRNGQKIKREENWKTERKQGKNGNKKKKKKHRSDTVPVTSFAKSQVSNLQTKAMLKVCPR